MTRARSPVLAALLLSWGTATASIAQDGITGALFGKKLIAALERATQAQVTIDGIELQPLDAALQVSGVRIENGRGVVKRLEVEHLRIALRRLDLLSGNLRLKAVSIDGMQISVGPDEREGAAKSGRFDAQLLEGLEQLELQRGQVQYSNAQIRFALNVGNVAIVAAPAGGGLKGKVSVGPIEWQAEDLPWQKVAAAEGEVAWRAPRLQVLKLKASDPNCDATAAAVVSLIEGGVAVRGEVDARLALAPLLSKLDPSAVGTIDAHARFRAAHPGAWQVEGTLQSEQPFVIAGLALSQGKTRFESSPEGTALTDGTATLEPQTSLSNIAIDWRAGEARIEADATAPVEAWLEKFSHRHGPLDGNATMHLVATRGSRELGWKLSAAGQLTSAHRDGGVSGLFNVSLDQSGLAIGLNGRWAGAGLSVTLEGDRAMTRWGSRFALKAEEAADSRRVLQELLEQLSAFGIETLRPYHPEIDGGLDIVGEVTGTRSQLETLDASLVGMMPRYERDRFERLELRIRRDKERLHVDGRLADQVGYGAQFAVEVPHGEPPHVELAGSELPWSVVTHFARIVVPDLDLPISDGLADFSASGTWGDFGSPLAITARAAVKIDDRPFELGLTARARPDSIEVQRLQLSGANQSWSTRGLLTVPGRGIEPNYEGQLQIHSALAGLPLEWAIPPVQGELDLDLTGSYRNSGPLMASGVASWRHLVWDSRAWPDGTTELVPTVDGAMARFTEGPISGSIQLSGIWSDPVGNALLQWSGFDLLDLAQPDRSTRPLSLSLLSDGDMQLSGRVLDLSSLSGAGTLRRLDLVGPTYGGSLEQATPLKLERGGRLTIDAAQPMILLGEQRGRLSVSGATQLWGLGAGSLAVELSGTIDLGALEVFHPDLLASGRVSTALSIGGTIEKPELRGSLAIHSGRIRLLPYPESIEGLRADLVWTPGQPAVIAGRCRLGGGEIDLSGSMLFEGWLPSELGLQLDAKGVGLTAPRGVWGRYDGTLKIGGSFGEPEISGSLTMISGRYTRPFGITTLSRVRALEPVSSSTSVWSTIALNIKIRSDDALAVRNDIANLSATADLDLRGTLRQPLLAGNIFLLEGGRFRFRDNDYLVDSGQVVLDDERGEPPQVRLRATTEARGYRIRLDLDATTERLDYQLTSTPALSEPDILSLLITGQTLSESGGESGITQAENTTTYFGSKLGELLLSPTAQKLLGVDQFQISPSQVGPETNPTARVTIGRRIDERTRVIYSRDISAEGRDVYRLERDLSREWRITLGREAIGSSAADLRWLHRTGGDKQQAAQADRPELSRLDIIGLPEGLTVHGSKLGLREGVPLTPASLGAARDSLRLLLVHHGWLEAQVELRTIDDQPDRSGSARQRVEIKVTSNRHWNVSYSGNNQQVKLAQSILEQLWADTGVLGASLREASSVVKDALADQGYAAAIVQIDSAAGKRDISVTIDAGPKVEVADLSIEGCKAFEKKELLGQVLSRPKAGISPGKVLYRPRQASEDGDAIRTYYEAAGFLEADVKLQERYSADGSKVYLTYLISEGQRWKVGTLRVEGDWPDALGPATAQIPLRLGERFEPGRLALSEAKLRELLDNAGYDKAEVLSRVSLADGRRADVVFRVNAGRPTMVREIRFKGLDRTRHSLADQAVKLSAGKPLTRRGVRETERELFKLGLFRKVRLDLLPVEGQNGTTDVEINVEEIPRISFLTTFGYDTEERIRGSFSVTDENVGGVGRVASLQAFGSQLRYGVRATLEDKHLFSGRWLGLITADGSREQRAGFTLTEFGTAFEIGSHRNDLHRWRLRYQLEANRLTDLQLSATTLDEISKERLQDIRLGGLIGSYILDRRNDPFVPKSGWVVRAEAGIYAAPLLSESDFARLTASVAGYLPFGSRFTFAGSLRGGLAEPFGRSNFVPFSRRFYIGGAQSLRSLPRDEGGPQDSSGNAIGGEVLLLANLEVRYRIFSEFEAVLFSDLGNVWLDRASFSLRDTREALGLGFRYITRVGALRLEYGRNLDRQPGESNAQLFFSIGETF